MSVYKEYYNREHGSDDGYAFRFEKENNGTITIRCLDHPDNPNSSDPRQTHLYESGKVCVAEGREPRSMEMAEAIAHAFMQHYSNHIRG